MNRVRTLLVAFAAALLCALPMQAQAQTGTVTGRILDATSMRPLAGATVDAGGRQALSNADGRFLVTNVEVGVQLVRVQLLGYADATAEVTVSAGQTTVVDIEMTTQALALEGLVVTGYGQSTERDLTGVVEAVDAEEFQTGRIVSPEELIQGKLAGVQIVQSGEPGGGAAIRIRGGTSINASNDPLIVIDGIPLAVGGGLSAGRNPLNFINPQDIASITVLKDASAAAIYGSRGANGVIIIETKGGESGASLEYLGTFTGQVINNDVSLVGANDFRSAVSSFAPGNVGLLGSANTDWRDAIQRTGFGQEHSLSISGGTQASNYRIGLNYLNQESIIQGSDLERLGASLNFNQILLNDRLKFEASIRGTRTEDNFLPGGLLGNATNMAPSQPILDPAGQFRGFFEWGAADLLVPNNPLAELAAVDNQGSVFRSQGGLQTTYDLPVTGLSVVSNIGFDIVNSESVFFAPSFLKSQVDNANPGFVSRSNNSQQNVAFDAYVNYVRPVGDDSRLEVTGGYSYEDFNAEFPSFNASGLSTNLLGVNGVPAANEQNSSIFVDEARLISFFGRVNYDIAGKYLFTGSLRRDGSSRFGPQEQWGIFPSAAFAWRLSDEDFFDYDFISDLKLRASWGITGNQQFANYQQFSDYLIGDQFARVQFGNRFVTTIRPAASDPGIKWEETTSWNFGVDFGLFDNRFTGALEIYQKDTDDLIFTVPVARGTALSNFVTTNVGSVQNRGVEFTLEAALFEGDGDGSFTWDASTNFAFNDAELGRISVGGAGDERILTGGIAGGVGSTIQVLQPGAQPFSFFTFQHIRGPDGLPIYEDTNGDLTINEQDLYVDINGDGIINQDDRVVNGAPAPDVIIGHSSYMTLGDFDLTVALRAYLGNQVYNNVASDAGHYQRLQGAVPYSLHSSVLETNFETPQFFSDYYVEDADFLRVDNITLGYTLGDVGIASGARVFVAVQNALTLTGYSGIDPEAGLGGIDNNIFPFARTFTAGLSFGF